MRLLKSAPSAPAPGSPGATGQRRVWRRRRGVPKQTATFTRADVTEKQMGRQILEALRSQASRTPLSQLADIVATASPEEIYEAASAGGGEALAVKLQAAEMDALQAGGDLAGRQVAGANVVINLGRPGVQGWLADHTAELVKQVTSTQREAVRLMIEEGVSLGRHPSRLAKDVRQAVSLDSRRAQAVINRRRTLMEEGLRGDRLEKRVQVYADKLLKQRAETIARTESMTAVNQGRLQLWEQLKDDGALPATIEQQWITAEDERVCPICGPLHLMRQPVGQPWESEGESTNAPPIHPNCRCTVALIQRGKEENV